MEADGENTFAVAMTASAGPVKAKFKGRVNLVDIDAPYTYTIVFERQGGTAGFGKGRANVDPELGDNVDSTMLSYTAHAQVGAKLAQIGSRLMDGAARKIAGEFFKRFSAQLTQSDEPEGESMRRRPTAQVKGRRGKDHGQRGSRSPEKQRAMARTWASRVAGDGG
jgi:carbon monoxide dehydrogenase subunit G